MRAPNINLAWGGLVVEELVRNGVDRFCIAPGSRSAPLAIAAASHRGVRRVVHADERALAFHALGVARATGRPAAVLTTSGTAAANLLPAAVEASQSGVPLILLTADRPPELRDAGANQAIDQVKLFGSCVRWQFDLPCPDPAIRVSFVLTTVDQAVHRAVSRPPGPVHLNLMFREPLSSAPDRPDVRRPDLPPGDWVRSGRPFTAYARPRRLPPADAAEAWLEIAASARRGLVVAGPCGFGDDGAAAARLADRLGWPVLADVLSPLRGRAAAVPGDAVLLSERFARSHRPDVILQVGGRPVSKRVARFVAESGARHRVAVEDHPWRTDPEHGVTLRIECGPEGYGALLPRRGHRRPEPWRRAWRAAARAAAKAWDAACSPSAAVTEPGVAGLVLRGAPRGHDVFFGNSMPVRDADAYPAAFRVRVFASRGASGIDGTLATAAGLARGSGRGLTAVLGDLAVLHDLGSLGLARGLAAPFVLVVVNNDGGGIFSFLPVAGEAGVFEEVFGAPHGLSFRDACAMFGLPHEEPRTAAGFAEAYARAVRRPGPSVIEVRTERRANCEAHARLQRAIAAAVDGAARA
jgi:2-succinyl-5-enolpyruvyl-6-hydroxy-3-cyclohexene-1-carboxylate synthase